MKKVKSLFLFILLAAIPVSAICQKAGSNENIRSIVVTEEKYDMLIKKQYKESETYYDTKGNLIESITYKLGKVDKHFKYQYDADNNKIKEEEFDMTGRIKESSEYKYTDGLRTEKIVYDSNRKMKSKKTYVYTKF
jgi:antitoxin component YwqK of YwqJK toxin-antitoxin module